MASYANANIQLVDIGLVASYTVYRLALIIFPMQFQAEAGLLGVIKNRIFKGCWRPTIRIMASIAAALK